MSFEINNMMLSLIGIAGSIAGIVIGCVAQNKTKKLEAQFLQTNEITKHKIDVYSDFSTTLHNLPKNTLVPAEDLKRLCFIENKIMLLIENEYKKDFFDLYHLFFGCPGTHSAGCTFFHSVDNVELPDSLYRHTVRQDTFCASPVFHSDQG